MSLTGTFDVFSLPEVLRMLATAGKSGTLTVETEGRSAQVELYEGECCGAGNGGDGEPLVADHTPAVLHSRLLDIAFENAGERDGGFRFSADDHPRPRPAACTPIESVLDELDQIEREWHDIATVVPSTDAIPVLAPRLPSDEISITAFEWSLLAHLDGRTAVRDLPARAGTSLVGVCRALAGLVRRGAIDVAGGMPRPLAPEPALAPATVAAAPVAARVEAAAPAPVETVEPSVAVAVADEVVAEIEDDPGVTTEAAVTAEAAETAAAAEEPEAAEIAAASAPAPAEGDRGAMLRLFSALRE